MKNEIILYKPDELTERIEVRVEEETVWLNRHQIATLFGRDVKTIGKHINNVFSEGELIKEVVVANFATTTQHGAIKGKTQTLNVEYYNLDVIISVGYRVKSKQGTQFRIWANKVLKDYLLKGYSLNSRMNRIEENVDTLAKKVEGIDLQKHNYQYSSIDVKIHKNSHDRFLIIDEKVVYHIGASLKDLGKKTFAFSKIDSETIGFNVKEILKKLKLKT